MLTGEEEGGAVWQGHQICLEYLNTKQGGWSCNASDLHSGGSTLGQDAGCYDRGYSNFPQRPRESILNSVVFSPQANYTDRAIAAGQRS
jgi:hypothetical protein